MGLSIAHLLILVAIWTIWIVPLYSIMGRIGWARAWAFVALFPPLGLVLLWCIAFARWNSGEIGASRDSIK
jgi:hypothetical protein